MRRKLFSTTRIKLFCGSEDFTKVVVCSDCGHKIETSASTTNLLCPKCGGKRFNLERQFFSPEGTPEEVPQDEKRFSLFSKESEEQRFQKSFSDTTDQFELRLKKYSGSNINVADCERIFGKTSEEMVQKGFAEVSGNTMNISKDAFIQQRLFSKLIISITKVMDLDPVSPAPETIDGLNLCPKSIMLLKHAHGLGEDGFHSCEPSWMEDSGILRDLPLEFGGRSMEHPEFKKIIIGRYPDAPHNIMDLLGRRGVIKISGNHIDIIK